jgi:ketosteroid isomerase-like protein
MTAILEELNRDVWHPFVRTYRALDADAFLALHHTDLIRASGTANEVHDFAGYAAQIREFFAMVAGFGDAIMIDFRFHERIAAGDVASERGVFRLSVTPATGRPRTRYGRFHTYARRVDGRWRLASDYDTNEGADAAAFAAGAEIDDVARFAR